MKKNRVTPAEAKAVWDSLEKPSLRKVADKFMATDRSISYVTIANWKRNGWGPSAAGVAKAAAAALAKMDMAAPALTGDARSTTADIVAARAAETKGEPPDTRSFWQHAEDALLKAIRGAGAVWDTIHDIATAQPRGKDATDGHAPPMLLLAAPDGISKVMMTATEAINKAIEGGRQLAVSRAEEAAAVPGAQTVYPPGQGPHAESSHADGSQGEGAYPTRAAIEALDQALKKIRERKP